jgi:hypothetical protein
VSKAPEEDAIKIAIQRGNINIGVNGICLLGRLEDVWHLSLCYVSKRGCNGAVGEQQSSAGEPRRSSTEGMEQLYAHIAVVSARAALCACPEAVLAIRSLKRKAVRVELLSLRQ